MTSVGGTWLWGALADTALLLAAVAGICWWRLGWPPPRAYVESLFLIFPITLLALPPIFYGFGLYLRRAIRTAVRAAVFAEGLLFLITLGAAFWLRGFAFPLSVLIVAFALHFVSVIGWRVALESTRRSRPQRVVVVAPLDEAVQVVEKLLQESENWYEIVRVIEPEKLIAEGHTGLAGIDLAVAGPSVVGPMRLRVLKTAVMAGVRVFVMPELRDILLVGSTVNQIADTPVFEIKPLSLTRQQRLAKRIFDLLVAVPMFLLLLPVMICVFVSIKLFSPGPALFKQRRVGLNGKEFVLFKFRTMVVDAEKETGPVLASANDPRITPIGEFLRATRLDELPQLINVIKGDMSLVGPRPERRYFVEQYRRELPEYDLRHLVPPGITGLAQVMGRYHTSAADKLRFDLYYIRNYSIWMDLKILLLTLQAVINKESAAGVGSYGPELAARAQELVFSRSSRA